MPPPPICPVRIDNINPYCSSGGSETNDRGTGSTPHAIEFLNGNGTHDPRTVIARGITHPLKMKLRYDVVEAAREDKNPILPPRGISLKASAAHRILQAHRDLRRLLSREGRTESTKDQQRSDHSGDAA